MSSNPAFVKACHFAIAGTLLLGFETFVGSSAGAQTVPFPELNTTGSSAPPAIGLGGRSLTGPDVSRAPLLKERDPGPVQVSIKGGMASDYMYRGTTLSDRKPAVGAGIEATYSWLYAGATVASVHLPTQPSSEITVSGGVRPSLGNIDFDFGATSFFYPSEMPGGATSGIEYWEATARADTTIAEAIRVAGGFAYSPNVSNTGAWSWYAAFGAGYQVPSHAIPLDIGVMVTAAAGYSWFGNQALALGGFKLPDYLNWQAGVTFSHKFLNLDLRYHDTNLSKENCYVFTGDPNAKLGGRADPITNPAGLTSNWCSATFVAKLWVELN